MNISGKFDIELTPQEDAEFSAGRMLMTKSYFGEMRGSATGQMISKRIEDGPAVYFAVEEFTGSVGGKSGAFTLLHVGKMSKESQSQEVSILEGSGSGELETIAGSMVITQGVDGHQYELNYTL